MAAPSTRNIIPLLPTTAAATVTPPPITVVDTAVTRSTSY